jgi:hypothetical protein
MIKYDKFKLFDFQKKETQQITDETGHVLTLNITHKESEEDIDVHNEKGNIIMTIDMMEKEVSFI